jgi:hypothetical protein
VIPKNGIPATQADVSRASHNLHFHYILKFSVVLIPAEPTSTDRMSAPRTCREPAAADKMSAPRTYFGLLNIVGSGLVFTWTVETVTLPLLAPSR